MAARVRLTVELLGGRTISREYDPQAAGLRLAWAAGLAEFVSAKVVRLCLLAGMALATGCAGLGVFLESWDASPRYGRNSRGEFVQTGGEPRRR